MGWGNILLTWPRYARNKPGKHCERCQQNFAAEEEKCPHCSHMDDNELQIFQQGIEAKTRKQTRLVATCFTLLVLYAITVLFILPAYLN